MIALAVAIGVVLAAIIFLAVVVHRDDAKREDRRKVDPFHAETERLAAAGLLFQVGDETGVGRGPTYYVTPAGEAALRAYRASPAAAPSLLSFAGGGLAMPGALEERIDVLRAYHGGRAARLRELITLLEGAGTPEWANVLSVAKQAYKFERHSERFWKEQSSADGWKDTKGLGGAVLKGMPQ